MIILFVLFFFIQLHGMEHETVGISVTLSPQEKQTDLGKQFIPGKFYTLTAVEEIIVGRKIKDITFVSYILSLICWKQDQQSIQNPLHYSTFEQLKNFGETQQTLAKRELRAKQTKNTVLRDLFKSYAVPTGCFLFGAYCHYLWVQQKMGTKA